MTADLAARLAEALDRAEQATRAAGGKPWTIEHHRCDSTCDKDCEWLGACTGGTCGHCVIDGGDIRIYDEGGHDTDQAAHIIAWQPSRVLKLIARDRALVAAHASADRNVSDHVARCGPDMCGCRDYLAATTTLLVLNATVQAAARFWLPEETR